MIICHLIPPQEYTTSGKAFIGSVNNATIDNRTRPVQSGTWTFDMPTAS